MRKWTHVYFLQGLHLASYIQYHFFHDLILSAATQDWNRVVFQTMNPQRDVEG
jgi:hypothetical protein